MGQFVVLYLDLLHNYFYAKGKFYELDIHIYICLLNKIKIDLWFGLIEVKPINGNNDLGEGKGAYVNVAYVASNKADFVNIVTESFTAFNYNVIEIEDIEREDQLSINNSNNAEKLQLLKSIRNGDKFAWGVFHTYQQEDI